MRTILCPPDCFHQVPLKLLYLKNTPESPLNQAVSACVCACECAPQNPAWTLPGPTPAAPKSTQFLDKFMTNMFWQECMSKHMVSTEKAKIFVEICAFQGQGTSAGPLAPRRNLVSSGAIIVIVQSRNSVEEPGKQRFKARIFRINYDD